MSTPTNQPLDEQSLIDITGLVIPQDDTPVDLTFNLEATYEDGSISTEQVHAQFQAVLKVLSD